MMIIERTYNFKELLQFWEDIEGRIKDFKILKKLNSVVVRKSTFIRKSHSYYCYSKKRYYKGIIVLTIVCFYKGNILKMHFIKIATDNLYKYHKIKENKVIKIEKVNNEHIDIDFKKSITYKIEYNQVKLSQGIKYVAYKINPEKLPFSIENINSDVDIILNRKYINFLLNRFTNLLTTHGMCIYNLNLVGRRFIINKQNLKNTQIHPELKYKSRGGFYKIIMIIICCSRS